MTLFQRLLLGRMGPDITSASIIQPVMTTVGVFTFLAGGLYLPALTPTRVEMIGLLLLLATVAMLCHIVGQLAVLLEHMDRRSDKSARPHSPPSATDSPEGPSPG